MNVDYHGFMYFLGFICLGLVVFVITDAISVSSENDQALKDQCIAQAVNTGVDYVWQNKKCYLALTK